MKTATAEKVFLVFKWTVAAMLLAAAAFVGVNAFDESLHPEVKAFLEPPPPLVPAAARNGYFQLVGLALPGRDDEAHAAGARYVEALAAAQARRLAGEAVEWPEPPPKAPPPPKLCAFDGASCLAEVAKDPAAARRIVEAQHGMLVRYRALLEYPEYLETYRQVHYDAPLAPFGALLNAQRAYLVDAALLARNGAASAVVADLERSMRFSRAMLAGSTTLIGKMVAASHARRTVQLASELLASPAGANAQHAARIGAALAPLAAEERRIARVMSGEFRMQLSSLAAPDAQPTTRMAWYFLQRNATANRDYFGLYKPFLELDAASAERFDALREALRRRDRSPPVWSLFYNPLGKMLSSVATPDWTGYLGRLHDLDALMRLVALQAAIAAEGTAEELPELAAAREARYADPYTARPMQWDAARRQLFFVPRAPSVMKGGGVAGRYGVTF